MCGISGFDFKDRNLLKKMVSVIRHRGPDRQGYYTDNNASLGHARLSIIDLSEKGKQPMHNEDKSVWIVFNGEIYNFEELKKGLKQKHVFRSRTDTEVLVHLYEELGFKMTKKLNGMFAFCIYDRKKKIFFCARDRFGKKPFYYMQSKRGFAFSSELKSLLEVEKPKIDKKSAALYFVFGFVPSPKTLFNGIKKLEAGHCLIYKLKNSELARWRYWDFTAGQNRADKKLGCKDYRKELEDALINATKSRLISDVPLGVFLSGGIDSSLVLGFLSRITDTKKVSTFSIGYREKAYDESGYAKKVADMYGTKHHVKIITAADCLNALPEIVEKMDEPISDPSIIPTYLLCKYARKHITVALSGDGADELFGGYPKYFVSRWLKYYDVMPKFMKNSAKKILLKLPTKPENMLLSFKVKKGVKSIDYPDFIRNCLWASGFELDELGKLFPGAINPAEVISEISRHGSAYKGSDRINRHMYLDVKLMLQDMYLVKIDRASMFNSLEVRSPFLDTNVAGISANMPSSCKVKGFTTKKILKQIAKSYLPAELVNRKKRGFGVPLSRWVSDDLFDDIHNTIKSTKFSINKEYALMLLEDSKKGIDSSEKLWNLYMFLKWHKKWVE
jgi:asparagine synthase (glutamine-hydrolysing)